MKLSSRLMNISHEYDEAIFTIAKAVVDIIVSYGVYLKLTSKFVIEISKLNFVEIDFKRNV